MFHPLTKLLIFMTIAEVRLVLEDSCLTFCYAGEKCHGAKCVECEKGTYRSQGEHTETTCIPHTEMPPGNHWVLKQSGTFKRDNIWVCADGYKEYQYSSSKSNLECRPKTSLPPKISTTPTATSSLNGTSDSVNIANTTPSSDNSSSSNNDIDTNNVIVIIIVIVISVIIVVFFVAFFLLRKRKRCKSCQQSRNSEAESTSFLSPVEQPTVSSSPSKEHENYELHKDPLAATPRSDSQNGGRLNGQRDNRPPEEGQQSCSNAGDHELHDTQVKRCVNDNTQVDKPGPSLEDISRQPEQIAKDGTQIKEPMKSGKEKEASLAEMIFSCFKSDQAHIFIQLLPNVRNFNPAKVLSYKGNNSLINFEETFSEYLKKCYISNQPFSDDIRNNLRELGRNDMLDDKELISLLDEIQKSHEETRNRNV